MIGIIKIISGGQSGVDRAALDFALNYGVDCGGWCPKGRLAEDGVIDQKYPLTEASDSFYQTRTELNVRDSDGTLILFMDTLDEGSLLTQKIANSFNKPLLEVDIKNVDEKRIKRVQNWIRFHKIKVLNIAGPRESNSPGIYQKSMEFLERLNLSWFI